MTTLFNEKENRKKFKILKLYTFTSLKDLTYNMFENKEELIKIVISRTNKKLIRYNKKKVFFIHPFFNRYGYDIHGDIFDLVQLNQPRIYSFQNIIKIDINFNDAISHEIQYDYTKFVSEALKLYKSDILKYNFEPEYEEAIYNEKCLRKTLKYDIKKYNKHIYDILNYSKNDKDDLSSDNDNCSDNDDCSDNDNRSNNDDCSDNDNRSNNDDCSDNDDC